MDNIKKKIIQKNLKQNIYMPLSVRFNFKEFKQLNGIEKMNFLLDKKMLSYNSHKLLEIEDLEQIFIDFDKLIETELQKTENQFTVEFFQIVDKFNNFLTNLTEDKHYLLFRSFEKILQLLEQCWNLDIIYITLEIIMNVFTIRTKHFQEIMLDLEEGVIYKLFYQIHLWFYGINFCNKNQFKSNEYFQSITAEDFASFDVNIFQISFFEKFDFKNISEKKYFNHNNQYFMNIDLSRYKNQVDLKQIIQNISQELQINIDKDSLFAQALKMRMILYNSCVYQNKILNNLNIQNMLFLNVSSYLILFHSSKVQTNLETHNQIRVIINQSYFLDYAYFDLEVFEISFQQDCLEEYQIRSIVSLFNFYNSLEYNPEKYFKLETFLRKILQSMVHAMYKGIQNSEQLQSLESNEYCVIPNDEFLHQFTVILWLFYEEDDDKNNHTIQYSAVMDSIIGIINYYDSQLQKQYNRQQVFNLAKIICMIKNEVHKDKEVVFLDILLELFDTHMTLYFQYKSQIKEYPNVLNVYVQLLFEIIEGMFFYILDPAKQKLIHQVPQIARQILEHKFWDNESYFELVKTDQQFYQIFCMSVSLMNDLLYELPENIQQTMMRRFIDNKVINLINEFFLLKNFPCDYDVVSFYIKLICNYHLHFPNVITEDDIKVFVERIFVLVFHKQMVENNVKRFLSTYTNETIRNLAEDLIMLTNVHPKFMPLVLQNLDKFNENLSKFDQFAMKVQIQSNTIEELIVQIKKENSFVSQYGWFNYEGEPDQRQLYDDFYLLQKHLQNVFKFQAKFFDHSRSNIFKKFFDEKNEQDVKYFDYLFDRSVIFLDNLLKFRKNSQIFFKHLLLTNNFFAIGRFQIYVIQKLVSENSYFSKVILYYSLCNEEEKQFIANLFLSKTAVKEKIFQTDLKNVTENTYNLINNFRGFVSLIECLKSILQNEQFSNQTTKQLLQKSALDFIKMIQNYRKFTLDILLYQKDELFKQNAQEIENLLLENYTIRIKINQNTVLETLLRKISFIKLDFFEQVIADVQHVLNRKRLLKFNESSKFNLKQYIESFFVMGPMQKFEKEIALDQKMIYYNRIITSLGPLFVNRHKYDKNPVEISKVIYVLCKKQFYSKFLIDCIKDIFEYVKINQKVIKKLLIKKELEIQTLDVTDIQTIYKFDENLGTMLVYIRTMIIQLFKKKQKPYLDFTRQKKINNVDECVLVENEKFDFTVLLMDLIKNTDYQNFMCFNYVQRSIVALNYRKSNQNDKDENLFKIDISQIEMFKKFFNYYRSFIKQIFQCFGNIFVQQENNKDCKKDRKLIKMAEQMGFENKLIKKVLRNFDPGQSKDHFISLLLEQQSKSDHSQIETLKTPMEIQVQDQQIKQKQQKMKIQLCQNLNNFVNYTFVNFLKYKELYEILCSFWLKYQKDFRKQKPIIKKLLNQIYYAIKRLTGLQSKQKKNQSNKWEIDLQKPRDALYYLLKLQNKICNQFKFEYEQKPIKTRDLEIFIKPCQSVQFLLNLLSNLAIKKNKVRRIQDPINTIIDIISEMSHEKKEKLQILNGMSNLFKTHKKLLNQKQKRYLIDEKILLSILQLTNKLIYKDDDFTKELIYFQRRDYIKNILRIELFKNSKKLDENIVKQLRYLIEQIIRKKSTLKILIQSEIINVLRKNDKILLRSFANNFQRYMKGCEELFTHAVKKLCIVEQKDNEKYISLKKDCQIPLKNLEIKNFIKDFMKVLIKDLIYKNTKKYQNQKQNCYFNDLIISDILFLQILPRYPFLYLIKSSQEKTLFTIYLFEKFIKFHWGYITFFEPLIYDSHFLTNDSENQTRPINCLLLQQIFDLITELILKIKQDFSEKQKLDVLTFINIQIYLLNILTSSHVFKKFENHIQKILQELEELSLEIIIKKSLQVRFENFILAISVVMRRIQILYLLNKENIKEVESQNQHMAAMKFPTTFSYKLNEWPDKVQKNINRDYAIIFSNKSHITYEKFLTMHLSSDNNFSKILNRLKRFQFQNTDEEPPIVFRGALNRNTNQQNDLRQILGLNGIRHFPPSRNNMQEMNFLMRQEEEVQNLDDLDIIQRDEGRPRWEFVDELEGIDQNDDEQDIEFENENEIDEEDEDQNSDDDDDIVENDSWGDEQEDDLQHPFEEVVEIYDEEDLDDDSLDEGQHDFMSEQSDEQIGEVIAGSEIEEDEEDIEVNEYDQEYEEVMYFQSSENESESDQDISSSLEDEGNQILDEDKSNAQNKKKIELFENYPTMFPLNLANTSFNFYEDQMNQYYQFYLTKYLLFNCSQDSQQAYYDCDQDFVNFDFKQWTPKKTKKPNRIRRQYQRHLGTQRRFLDFELLQIGNRDNNFQHRLQFMRENELQNENANLLRAIRMNPNQDDYNPVLNNLLQDGYNNNSNQNLYQILQEEIEVVQQNDQEQDQQAQQQQQVDQSTVQRMTQHIINFMQQNEERQDQNNSQQLELQQQQNVQQQQEQFQQQNQMEIEQDQQQIQDQNQQQQNEQQEQTQYQQQQQNENQQQEEQVENVQQLLQEQNINNEQSDQQQIENQIEQSQNNDQPFFDFGAIGLPNNFLEIAQIDPTFFYALPADLQAEIAIEQGDALNLRRQPVLNTTEQQQNQNQNNDQQIQENESNAENQSELNLMMQEQNQNLVFLESLAPDMREEVLLTCPDEFLQSLPFQQQQEAAELRQNNTIQQRYIQRNNQQQSTNVLENKVKKNLKGYQFTEKLKSIYPVNIYQPNKKLLEVILNQLKDPSYNLRYIPLSLLSCLLFDQDNQQHFLEEFFEVMQSKNNRKTKLKFLVTTLNLTYANFHVFLDQTNYQLLIEFLPRHKNDVKIIGYLLRIITNVTKRSVTLKGKEENCCLTITERSLEHLTQVSSISSTECPVSDYLSLILMILSFKRENLTTIVANLKDNISKFALNLNIHLKAILETKKDTKQEYMEFVEKIIMKNLSMYHRFQRLFKLVEGLFSRSFKSNLKKEGQTQGKKDLDLEEQKLLKVKEQVLKEFSNYFEDQSIKRVFNKVFKIINFFELNFDQISNKKNFSKPTFFKMLDLMESFFLLYKIYCDDEDFQSIKKKYNIKQKQQTKIADYTDQIKSEEDPSEKEFNMKEEISLEQMFNQICKKNYKVLNFLMNKMPKLSSSPLKIIIKKYPKLVDFQLKRKYFTQKISSLRIKQSYLKLKIRREMLFTDSFTQLVNKKPLELRQKLHIKFQNEEGEDAGGLTRAWFQLLSKEIFNPNYALFIPAAHGYAYQPSPYSSINQEHLKYFKFIGRIVGKTLFDGQLLDAHFTRSFYKHMVGTSLNYFDFEDYDPEYFKTLKWMLENDVEMLDLTFCYETNHFGKILQKPLKPNGNEIAVTNENKKEYIKLLCYAKMANEIKPQIEAFLEGLHDIVPQEMIQIFTPEELELMISGLPQIDILDLKKNTVYVNYTKDDIVIQNFWKLMNNFDENQRAGFLQYVTGTSKVPLEGFTELKGIGGGIQKFQIHKAYDTNKLPTSHTCMNQLDLPNYETYEELKQKMTIAITYGKEGFGFL